MSILEASEANRILESGSVSGKAHKPKSSALDMAAGMGIGLLSEEEYRELSN